MALKTCGAAKMFHADTFTFATLSSIFSNKYTRQKWISFISADKSSSGGEVAVRGTPHTKQATWEPLFSQCLVLPC
jgi:hypothetical protein